MNDLPQLKQVAAGVSLAVSEDSKRTPPRANYPTMGAQMRTPPQMMMPPSQAGNNQKMEQVVG